MSIRVFYRVGLIAAGVILVASLGGLNAQQSTAEAVSIGNDDIGGVVSSAKGPEAGVLVIAETSDLPTKFVKIVVTDDGGRYVLPQLPKPRPAWPGVVITEWDWADPKAYLHDEIATDKRNPTLNPNGLIYGAAELSVDYLPVLNAVSATASQVKVPVRDPKTPSSADDKIAAPSLYWGDEAIWHSQANVHNPMFDAQGRVWITSRIRPSENLAFCKEGSSHPSAVLFPLKTSGRQLAVYDPKTKQVTLINTCFGTHHLVFAEDANNKLWTSSGGGGGAVGWLNTKMFDETHDEEKSQGWTALVLDTNGNGKRDEYVEPDQPVDPTKDKRINAAFYGVTVSPVDGSIWGTVLGVPGAIVRLNPGPNPPATALAEIYELPWNNPNAPVHGYSPRGLDIDRNGDRKS